MKKKVICGISIFASCVMLTGCCISHEWKDATCTDPKTCIKCGETEGEVTEHTWAEATCSVPRTCSVCGETEGNALEHTLTEANYQQASTCEVCGEIVGEPLQADFEKYDLAKYLMELDQEYDYKTLCNDDLAYATVGKAKFSNYRTFDSDETHPAKEGYEWKTVDITLSVGDENAYNYGISSSFRDEDYYDILKHDSTAQDDEAGMFHFTVNWNGIDYTECCGIFETEGWGGWTDNTNPIYEDWELINILQCRESVLVPTGYDGFVWGVINKAVESESEQYIYELDNTDSLFFRMK